MYKRIIFLVTLQVFLLISLSAKAQDEFSEEDTSSDIQAEADKDIQAAEEKAESPSAPEVEPTAKMRMRSCKCKYNIDTPYKERRTRWGATVGFQWGMFKPTSFTPNNNLLSYDARYGTNGIGSVEMVVSAKLNFALGSIGPQISAGYFTTSNATLSSTLNIIPLTAGINYSMDNILGEPYIVPYGVVGVYTGLYTEKIGGLSASGYAPVGMFYSAGVMFQLDWMDEDSHESGYGEYGMENTFLFVEARSFLQAPIITNLLTDMSTPLQIFAGLKTEF